VYRNSEFCGLQRDGKARGRIPRNNAFWPGLTPFGPPLQQVKQTFSSLCQFQPAKAVGQNALALAKMRYSTVRISFGHNEILLRNASFAKA